MSSPNKAASQERINQILQDHKAALSHTDIDTYADFSGLHLDGHDFSGKQLDHATFDGATLTNANLSGATFRHARFDGADLRDATFSDCKLAEATFFGANLQGARFGGATGLKPENLAATNLTGAELPNGFPGFEGVQGVDTAAGYARRLFFTLLAACTFCLLAIGTTTDINLITNQGAQTLPFVDTEIPLLEFYFLAPLVLVTVFGYFHVQMQRIWERLSQLPAIFPDGKPLDQKSNPWLLLGLVRSFFPFLGDTTRSLYRLQKVTSILIAWGSVPITLLFFWLRYLYRHDPYGSAFHILLFAIASLLAYFVYATARATLTPGADPPRITSTDSFSVFPMVVLLLTILCLIATPGAMKNGGFAADLKEANLSRLSLQNIRLEGADLQYATLTAADLTSARLDGANLRNARLDTAVLDSASLRDADMRSASLRFVHARGAIFENADLKNADLSYADLRHVRARNARFIGVTGTGARLDSAHLQKTSFHGAWLDSTQWVGTRARRTDLSGAFLDDGVFHRADLRDANILHARFTRAYARDARFDSASGVASFRDANLNYAQFDDADLYGIPTLGDDVRAKGLRYMIRSLGTDGAEIDSLSTDFDGARLEHASFLRADLHGHALCPAVSLRDAVLDSAVVATLCRHCPDRFSWVAERCSER